MSWNDLRKGRHSVANQIYFITFVVNHRKPLFIQFNLAHIFCKLLEVQNLNHTQWLTWVLMPDHFHGLLQLSQGDNLSQVIRRLKSKSAVLINRSLKLNGQIWQHAYFDRAIRKDEDLRKVSRYIVANPLRANIVHNVGDYPYWNSIYL